MRKRNNEEEQNQIWLMDWAKTQRDIWPYLIHIRNEGKRSAIEGGIAKRMGLMPGVSDLFFAYPKMIPLQFESCGDISSVMVFEKPGLWIEMKSKKGKLSDEQKLFIATMMRAGYSTSVCRSWTEGANVILDYMGREDRV